MSTGRKGWGHGQVEDDYRRKLLLRARKGDPEAQAELIEKFGMRVYSDSERSNMPAYYDSGRKGSPPSVTSASNRKSSQENSLASQGKAKAKTRGSNKEATKSTAKPKGKL